jgi:general secretion pathway protein M
MASLSQLTATVQTSFQTLTSRERRLVIAAGLAFAVFLVFIVTHSFTARADSIRARIEKHTQWLEEAQTLAAGYREARSSQEAVERQLAGSNVRLISYVEEKGQKAGLSIGSMNPKPDITLEGTRIVESAVETTLTDVKLNRLVEFLTSVETGGPGIVKVKYLRLEPRPANETVTAWVTVATYRMKN